MLWPSEDDVSKPIIFLIVRTYIKICAVSPVSADTLPSHHDIIDPSRSKPIQYDRARAEKREGEEDSGAM